MGLVFIVVANDEGLVMAETGKAPEEEEFCSYASTAMEMAQQMVRSGDLKHLICTALVLEGGQMLIMHQAEIEGQSIYLSILSNKVPSGVQRLIREIVKCISIALVGKES